MTSTEWNAQHHVLLDTIDCHAALSLENATVKISSVQAVPYPTPSGGGMVILTRTEMDAIAKAWLRYRVGAGA